jgi:hypothetical protein
MGNLFFIPARGAAELERYERIRRFKLKYLLALIWGQN